MDEKSLLARKNIIAILFLLLLIVGIFVAVRLAQQRQQPKSKAAESDPVHFVPGNGVTFNAGTNTYTTTNPTVQVQLRSPLGGPAQ